LRCGWRGLLRASGAEVRQPAAGGLVRRIDGEHALETLPAMRDAGDHARHPQPGTLVPRIEPYRLAEQRLGSRPIARLQRGGPLLSECGGSLLRCLIAHWRFVARVW